MPRRRLYVCLYAICAGMGAALGTNMPLPDMPFLPAIASGLGAGSGALLANVIIHYLDINPWL